MAKLMAKVGGDGWRSLSDMGGYVSGDRWQK